MSLRADGVGGPRTNRPIHKQPEEALRDEPWWSSTLERETVDRWEGLRPTGDDPLVGRSEPRQSAEKKTGPAKGVPEHQHGLVVEACGICPICTVVRVLGDSRPEIVAHLTEAARHLTLAAKAVIDAQAASLGGDDRWHEIPINE